MRIDAVHYCDRELVLSVKRKRRSFVGRNSSPKDSPQQRLFLLSRSVRENSFLARQVQYLKVAYMTREVCKVDLARTVSVLPNVRYVDLPDGFYTDDPSSNTLRHELQARCGDIRQMKYADGAERSFQVLAQAGQWPNLETLELYHLAMDPATISDVFTSHKALRHIKLTNIQTLDDNMFGSMHIPPLAVLELQDVPNVSAKGLLAYLSCPEVKHALKFLTLTNTGVFPLSLSQILAAAPSLTTLHIAEGVSRTLLPSQISPLASRSLHILHYEISSTSSSPRGLSSPSDSYYSCLSSSILTGALPSLSRLYVLSTSLPTMLLSPPQFPSPVSGSRNADPSVNRRPLCLYTKAVPEMEWNLTLISLPTPADRRGSATTTRPMSLFFGNQLSPQWRDKGIESSMVGDGFGGFLAVPMPSEDHCPGTSKAKKGVKDVDAWMG